MNKLIEKGLTTRHRILAVATRLFTKMGYEQTSIESLLDELNISRGALYHHFSSKEAIFEAVFEAVEADIAKAIIGATRGIADPAIALRTGCDAFLRMAAEEKVRQIALIDAPAALGWQKWREIEARHGFGLLKASLKAAAAKGRLRADLVDMYAHILLAALMETALLIARRETAAASRNGRAAVRDLIERLLRT
jgi:AcrR family transcriptional regulator